MPEISMPEINVKVFIGKDELKNIIRTEAEIANKKSLLGRR